MEAQFQQALALQSAGRLEEAEAAYRALADGRWSAVWHNLGVIQRTTGRLEAAEASFREALAINPARPTSRHSLGMTLLQLGRYGEGWPLFEARRETLPLPTPPQLPEWRGEPLAGRRLLVVGEQGQGDQILFARFLRFLSGGEVTLAASPSLRRLFEALPVKLAPDAWRGTPADCWTYLGSLPHRLGLGPADAPAPYLPHPTRDASAGVGLMLEGGTLTGNNPLRLPPPEAAEAIRALAAFTDLSPTASGAADFADTAAIVAGLSLVVSVDTSVAHLAGALGKPVWVLMARPAIDWHSHWADDRSEWYPSMRLIRQAAPGDWSGVTQALRRGLAGEGLAESVRP